MEGVGITAEVGSVETIGRDCIAITADGVPITVAIRGMFAGAEDALPDASVRRTPAGVLVRMPRFVGVIVGAG